MRCCFKPEVDSYKSRYKLRESVFFSWQDILLMMFSETVSVTLFRESYEKHTKKVDQVRGRNVEPTAVNIVLHVVTQGNAEVVKEGKTCGHVYTGCQ
jgi:hypothetical protein